MMPCDSDSSLDLTACDKSFFDYFEYELHEQTANKKFCPKKSRIYDDFQSHIVLRPFIKLDIIMRFFSVRHK